MKNLFLLSITVAFLISCQNKDLPGPIGDPTPAPIPEITPTPKPSTDPTPSESPTPEATPIQTPQPVSLDIIERIPLYSECAMYNFKEQGRAKIHYLQGVALTYARALCNKSGLVYSIGSKSVGNANVDALAHYSDKIKSQGLSVATPEERFRNTFSLIVGSAGRESSWRWCVGKDPGASNTTADSCESGLYQTSYDSRFERDGYTLNAARMQLFEDAKHGVIDCFSEQYKGSVTCSSDNMKNWGTGEGVTFQKLNKECPGFATEYHALMIRERRTHYGPINTKASELTLACSYMFKDIEDAIKAEPAVCLNFQGRNK